MLSICSSLQLLTVPQWRRRKGNICIFLNSTRRINFISCTFSSPSSASMNDDSILLPKQNQIDYDTSEEFFGLEVDLQPRNVISGAPKPRSWFGPNGQYIRELPCPSCRGRGYTPCTECGIERSKLDCSQCNGKGIRNCRQCLGDCVIWEESIDERPWEKARSISPIKVKEDDEVDNLDIKLDVRKKSKRIYQSPPPEVGLKISRSLRSLNAKTGLFTKRMKILHRNPELHAQRVAAIKKAKRTPEARKRASELLKAYYLDPENRRKKSIAMKGLKFYCSNCGKEGHRRYYCPELLKAGLLDTRIRCRLCGERGHNRRTCHRPRSSETKTESARTHHHCRTCGQSGHNHRTCPNGGVWLEPVGDSKKGLLSSERRRSHRRCQTCGQSGHNRRTCPNGGVWLEPVGDSKKGLLSSERRRSHRRCQTCGQSGHNRRTCPNGGVGLEPVGDSKKGFLSSERRSHRRCQICCQNGHNRRTCPNGGVWLEPVGDSKKGLLSSEGRNYTCRLCQGKGHNIRSCSRRNKDVLGV